MDNRNAGQLRRVEFQDIMTYRMPSTPKISPDGTKAAFFVHQGDYDNNCYRSCLWLCKLNSDEDVSKQLTFTGCERAFSWNKAGDGILFVSDRGNHHKCHCHGHGHDNDQSHPGLFSLSLNGGEARELARLPRAVSDIWDLGDGNVLLLTDDPDPRGTERFEDADYYVFEQIPFSANGNNFTSQRRIRLSLLKLSKAGECEFEDLTPPTMNVLKVRLDSGRVFVTACDYTDVMPLVHGVWEIDLTTVIAGNCAAGDALKQVLPQGAYRWTCAAPWPVSGDSGEVMLAVGSDMKRYGYSENGTFFVVKPNPEKPNSPQLTCLTPELDSSLSNSVITDCRMGCERSVTFIVEKIGSEPHAWFLSTDRYHSGLYSVDTRGVIRYAVGGKGEEDCDDEYKIRSVDDFDVKNGRAVIVALSGLKLPEVYVVELTDDGNNKVRCLTSLNATTLENTDLSMPEHVRIENGTPEGIDAWYMRPIGFEVGKKYPVILNIHGGPKGAFSDVFEHEMQCWAAKGFVVLFCNPRGGDGRGNAFADIRGHYGMEDYQDIMTFVDWAIKTLPFIDPDRMGVTGGSYGGFMTNWIIGHTNRFRAAATQRSICNWISMLGMSDIGWFFATDQQAADIGEDISALWNSSPLKYSSQMRTPTLIIHSDEDQRCELGQGLQLFTALKRNGVESRMCVFKGENHELSRGGRPLPRLARLQEITNWMLEKL